MQNKATSPFVDTLRQPAWSRADLLSALDRKQFVPFYQPKIDLTSCELTGVEVLTRWEHPEFGTLLPSAFLEQLERQGLIDQLTDCVIRQALSFARDHANIAGDIGFAINVSPTTLRNACSTDRLADLMKTFGVCAAKMTIELTENLAAEDSVPVHESLMRLRARGFQISLDDFGTGYSSMKLLSRMPFTELKIDRGLVSGAIRDTKLALILEAVIRLARSLQLQTVAEGIETSEEIGFLRALGCDIGQGFHFGLPMPQAEFIRYLQATAQFSAAA